MGDSDPSLEFQSLCTLCRRTKLKEQFEQTKKAILQLQATASQLNKALARTNNFVSAHGITEHSDIGCKVGKPHGKPWKEQDGVN